MSRQERNVGALGIVIEEDVDVPMRDGVVLRANVFRPDAPGRYPAILIRTPYGKAGGGYERFVRAGYGVVTQDSRGRYASDGDYVPFTVEHTGDAEDGYDSVEWLAQRPFCNGSVGTMGNSYNAWMQWQLAKLRPPHLVAMCACTIPLELTDVDWWGGFRPGRRVKWWMTSMAPDLRRRQGLPPPHTKDEALALWEDVEHGRWLGFMPWIELPRYLPDRLARYVKEWLTHPTTRPWKFAEIHREIEVPNFDFSGWYDHCGGTMAHLGLMQRNGRTPRARESTKLIIGPWNHPGIGSRSVGDVDFGLQAEVDTHGLIIRWFDYWLKGLPNGIDQEPAVRYFVMGSGRWQSASTWPPEGTVDATFYLESDGDAGRAGGSGALVARQSLRAADSDTYIYDPSDPTPTLWDRRLFTSPADRRVLEYRDDILYYRTVPLTEAVEVVGHPEVVLHASSSAPDTDFFARLVDEHPEGPALEICYGMVRARHRHSIDHDELLVPGETTEFRIRLGPTACQFQPGHRIRLEITSSDFPNHDRNHNTGRNDLADTELVVARQEVFHAESLASRLVLPIQA